MIAEVAFPAALTELHEKAIYLHEARQYQVERFDYEERKAYVRQVDCDYFTDAIDYTQVKSSGGVRGRGHRPARARRTARCASTARSSGSRRSSSTRSRTSGAGKLSMPEQEMHTTAFWLHFPAGFWAGFPDLTPTEKQNGLAGLGNALRTVGALLLMCDPRDLGVALTEEIGQGLQTFEPDLYLYDTYPGGIGQSEPLYRARRRLLEGAAALLAQCPCEAGCPSCVGPLGEIGERGKQAAREILEALLAAQPADSAVEKVGDGPPF